MLLAASRPGWAALLFAQRWLGCGARLNPTEFRRRRVFDGCGASNRGFVMSQARFLEAGRQATRSDLQLRSALQAITVVRLPRQIHSALQNESPSSCAPARRPRIRNRGAARWRDAGQSRHIATLWKRCGTRRPRVVATASRGRPRGLHRAPLRGKSAGPCAAWPTFRSDFLGYPR